MSYSDLYTFCQSLQVPVSRKRLTPKIKELCGIESIKVYKTTMDTDILLGYFVSPGAAVSVELPNITASVPTIVVARDLNHCWQRFVVIKELMHLFDTDLEKLGNAEELEGLVTELVTPQPTRSIAVASEVTAFWRAIGIMCPEGKRQEFQRLRDAQKMSDLTIATEIRMPVLLVPSLFEANYKQIVSAIMQ